MGRSYLWRLQNRARNECRMPRGKGSFLLVVFIWRGAVGALGLEAFTLLAEVAIALIERHALFHQFNRFCLVAGAEMDLGQGVEIAGILRFQLDRLLRMLPGSVEVAA